MSERKLKDALIGMVQQFAYWSDTAGGYTTGGLSALEDAFSILGWSDPMPIPGARCQIVGCNRQATCGTPTPEGYRRLCGEHYTEAERRSHDKAEVSVTKRHKFL